MLEHVKYMPFKVQMVEHLWFWMVPMVEHK